LFIDNINNLYTVYKDSVTPCGQLYPRRFLERDKMTQMTQRPKAPGRQICAFWVIWVTKKTMTQMTQSMPATGASLQFKTMTQMTQMTQSMAAGMHGHDGASMRHASAGRWPPAGPPAWPLAIPTMPRGGWVGPAAKGQQKRTDREQFFFSYKIFFLVE
jgi:hypothetical protein